MMLIRVANNDDLADGIGFDVDANAIVWNGNLASGTALAIGFQVDVDDDAEVDTLISNQAQLTVDAGGPFGAAASNALQITTP